MIAWGCHPTSDSAGEAILAKAHLIDSGALSFETPEPVAAACVGRLLGVRVKWGGLSIFLQDAYAPCAGHPEAARAAFLHHAAEQYAPWAATHRGRLQLCASASGQMAHQGSKRPGL